MAYQSYVPIIPVTIINSYQIFDRKYKGKKDIHLIFHKLIEPSEFINILLWLIIVIIWYTSSSLIITSIKNLRNYKKQKSHQKLIIDS